MQASETQLNVVCVVCLVKFFRLSTSLFSGGGRDVPATLLFVTRKRINELSLGCQ